MNSIETARENKKENYLNKPIYFEGRVITRKAWLEDLKSRGYNPENVIVIDYTEKNKAEKIIDNAKHKYLIIPDNRARGSNQNIPEVKEAYMLIDKIKNNEFKKEVFSMKKDKLSYALTKYEYEYAIEAESEVVNE